MNSKYIKGLTLAFMLLAYSCQGQSYQQQSRELLAYNVAFGGIVAGVGSAIHKHSNESAAHAFVNGFWKGCAGGAVNYGAECITPLMNKNICYGWGATLAHATGTSMVRNGVLNEPVLSNWQFEFGFLQVDVGSKVQLRPFGLSGFIYAASDNKFDFKTSVSTGKMFFESNEGACVTHINAIVINKEFKGRALIGKNEIVVHEFIHTLQEESFSVINNIYSLKFLPKWIALDIPFSDVAYFLEKKIQRPQYYNSNIFEFEADHFSTGKYLDR